MNTAAKLDLQKVGYNMCAMCIAIGILTIYYKPPNILNHYGLWIITVFNYEYLAIKLYLN